MPIRFRLALSVLDSATSAYIQAGQTASVVLNARPVGKRQSLPHKVQVPNKKSLISIEYDLRPLAPTNTQIGVLRLRKQFDEVEVEVYLATLLVFDKELVGLAS